MIISPISVTAQSFPAPCQLLLSEMSDNIRSSLAGFFFMLIMFQDHHKVFLIKANGTPKPHHEVKNVEYYKEGSNIRISKQTAEIIKKYNKIKKEPENKKPFWKFW